MPPAPRIPSEEEKERFLNYIISGDDRATAAWRINPEYTGTMFRSLCNPVSVSYDAEFATAYDEACKERGPLDPNRQQIWGEERESAPKTLKGYTKAMHLTESQLEEFLEMVHDGVMAHSAAQMVDPPTSMTQINRRAAKDPEFAKKYKEAKEEGYESYKESLRAEATRQAFAGDYRALRDQLIMHDDRARSALTTNKHEISGLDGAAIRLFAEQNFADLPKEMLDEMISVLERKQQGELGPGGV